MMDYHGLAPASSRQVRWQTFLSVDFSRDPSLLHEAHSPNSLNMIRDEYGKVRRRMGYKGVCVLSGKVHSMAAFRGRAYAHAGTNLYEIMENGSWKIRSDVHDGDSLFVPCHDYLLFLDGKELYILRDRDFEVLAATVPRVAVGCTPDGGGELLRQPNLLTDRYIQSYAGTGTDTVYRLAFAPMGPEQVAVRIETTDDEGNPLTLLWKENTDFSVDRDKGLVTFLLPPPGPSVPGEDNVFIEASLFRAPTRSVLAACTIGCAGGIGGRQDQVFLGGSPAFPHRLYWSDIDDPGYIGDLQYAILGGGQQQLKGLQVWGDCLLCHMDTRTATTFVVQPYMEELNNLLVPQVRILRTLMTGGCLSPRTTEFTEEPLFLSSSGVRTVAYNMYTDREVWADRSMRVNARLLEEPGLEKAFSVVCKGFYLLFAGDHVYVLDSLHPGGDVNQKDAQMNAFLWDDIPAVAACALGDRLFFGTETGRILEFYREESDPASYYDDGLGYEWMWELPEYTGSSLSSCKTLRSVTLGGKEYTQSAVALEILADGKWNTLLGEEQPLISPEVPAPAGDPPMRAIEISYRHLTRFSLRVRGSRGGMPFGLHEVTADVREQGHRRG